MNFEDLLAVMEIDSFDELAHFEEFAALVEYDDDIPFELFNHAVSQVSGDTLAELTETFFEDILKGVPDDSIDFYTLLSTIDQALVGLARFANSSQELEAYAEELFRFRNWYVYDSLVHCRNLSNNKKADKTVSQALALYRATSLNGDDYRLDFSDSMDYEIDEYMISIDASIDEDYQDIDLEDEDDHDLFEEGLIDADFPVIDSEDYDLDDEDY